MNSPSPKSLVISESARIPAAADRIYSIIADYRDGHPRILPKQFSGLTVDEGGVGAGTVIRFEMRSFGRVRKFHGVVSEPQPGRILAETYLDGTVTTFTLTPGASEADTEVTIKTEMPARRGLAGALEGHLAAKYLRPIFVEELKLLASVALNHEKPGR